MIFLKNKQETRNELDKETRVSMDNCDYIFFTGNMYAGSSNAVQYAGKYYGYRNERRGTDHIVGRQSAGSMSGDGNVPVRSSL